MDEKQHGPSRKDERQQFEPAAWNIPTWCAALDIGRSSFYVLEVRPRAIKVGKRTLIIESPAAYAERLAAMQADAKE